MPPTRLLFLVRVLPVRETTPSPLTREWAVQQRAVATVLFLVLGHLAQDFLVPAHRVRVHLVLAHLVQDRLVRAHLAQVGLVKASAQVASVSVRAALLEQVLVHVPVQLAAVSVPVEHQATTLVLTVHQEAAVAVAPAEEPQVRLVAEAARARHVSRSARSGQSSN